MKLIYTLVLLSAFAAPLKAQDVKDIAAAADRAHNISLRLYPLPAKTYINVYITANKPQYVTVKMFDDNYQSQISEWKAMVSNDYEKGVDVTKLPNGNYHVEIDYKGGSQKKDFTVAH